jgi:hypothetical protein
MHTGPRTMAKYYDLFKGGGQLLDSINDLSYELGTPPFTVLDSRTLAWRMRKHEWEVKGVVGAKGRDANLMYSEENIQAAQPTFSSRMAGAATSIFDPFLCELLYAWFCPKGGTIIDPFAGGVTRGAVASLMGFRYFGIDLREEQIQTNKAQMAAMATTTSMPKPRWLQGDSARLARILARAGCDESDFVMSGPPYFDMEKYSDDVNDLSNMTWEEFKTTYDKIIKQCVAHLKDNRFAAFMVQDVRDQKTGYYRGFICETVAAFERHGAHLYNDAILLNPTGLAAMKANKLFNRSRKLSPCHQHIVIFVKGDWKKATQALR